jgi:large subunit ribosomal protein L28
MSQAFSTARNALVSLSTSTHPPLQLKAVQSSRAIHHFHPWRPTTKLPDILSKTEASRCPPYPYGPRYTFKEADNGLYGGAHPQSGNKISKGKNEGKTRRKWYPNVRVETIRSEALDQTMTIPITASCLRTITKCGGLDQYLLGDKPARIKELGVYGWNLRWKVMNSSTMRLKFAKERKKLGLPRPPPRHETFEQAWERDEELRKEVQLEQAREWQELREKELRFHKHVKSRWRKDNARYSMPRVVPLLDVAAFDSFVVKNSAEQGEAALA